MIEILVPGAYTTIQDPGRPGHEIHGMPRSGAFDPFLASVANRIAGNAPEAPLLEFALTGPSLRFHRDAVVGLASFRAKYLLNGTEAPEFRPIHAPAGSSLEFRAMEGWFGYLSFSGGIAADTVLGSVSTYLQGRIGHRMARGDRFALCAGSGPPAALPADSVGFSDTILLRILPSLHTSLFETKDLEAMTSHEYRVLQNSDRMGVTLDGPKAAPPRVIRSTPAFPGSIQALPSGQLLLLGPDGPTTGGYPQIAMLSRVSWTSLAQARPGKPVRFEWITREEALRRLESRDSLLRNEAAWERK